MMQLKNIVPGQVYVVAPPQRYGATRDIVSSGKDGWPALVLGVGRYRTSRQPCGTVWVDSEDKYTSQSALCMIPKPYIYDEQTRETIYWTWDEPWGGGDCLDWPWDIASYSPRQMWPLLEWAAKHQDLILIDDEVKANRERVRTLKKEITDELFYGDNLVKLLAESKLIPTAVKWDWNDNMEAIHATITTKASFPPHIRRKIDEIAALNKRYTECLR